MSCREIKIAVEEKLAVWARKEAKREGISLSELIARILRERMADINDYEAAMKRSLVRRPFLNGNGALLSRDEAHRRK
jgi:hypothetical protein